MPRHADLLQQSVAHRRFIQLASNTSIVFLPSHIFFLKNLSSFSQSLQMPPPTSSLKPTAAKPASDTGNGAKATGDKKSGGQLAKPDQSKYNAEQDEINKEIAAVKEKIVSVYMADTFIQYCAEAHGILTAFAPLFDITWICCTIMILYIVGGCPFPYRPFSSADIQRSSICDQSGA